jgi:hypothetical protein
VDNFRLDLATQYVWLVALGHTFALHDTGGASAAPAGTLLGACGELAADVWGRDAWLVSDGA